MQTQRRPGGSAWPFPGRPISRAISTFEHLDEVEIEAGFRRMDAGIAAGPDGPTQGDCDLLVLG